MRCRNQLSFEKCYDAVIALRGRGETTTVKYLWCDDKYWTTIFALCLRVLVQFTFKLKERKCYALSIIQSYSKEESNSSSVAWPRNKSAICETLIGDMYLPRPHSRAFTQAIHRFGVHHRYRRLQPHKIACLVQPRATNTWGNCWNSIKWILSLRCGRWSIYLCHHKNCIAILVIGNVSDILWHRSNWPIN